MSAAATATAEVGDAGPAGRSDNLAAAPPSSPKKQRRGFFVRLWRGIFGRGNEDYEKRLRYLSKEEAAVHARLKRRAQTYRRIIRDLIVLSVLLEVAAVVYAVVKTRSPDLDWQMRAKQVLPMFLLPASSFIIYSTVASFTRMFDRKDQKTLERLRAERKAKIDELKEITNYYATQQLIQKYDLDPAAKAAAATVLASKLGADSGLKVFVGDETARSNDTKPSQTTGLRNRKQSQARSNTAGATFQSSSEISYELEADGQEISADSHKVVEHYKGTSSSDGGWLARLAAILVGEDPSQSYALICGNCYMHNGLARKEDYPHISYYCPHCNALNTSRQSGENDSDSSSGMGVSFAPVNRNSQEFTPKSEVTGDPAEVPEPEELQLTGKNDEKQSAPEAS